MTTYSWLAYPQQLGAALRRQRRRRDLLVIVLGAVSGALVGVLLVLGWWWWAGLLVVNVVVWTWYRSSRLAAYRDIEAAKRAVAREVGMCPRCLVPGPRHYTDEACTAARKRTGGTDA